MRYNLFLQYRWFLQNLGKDFIRTNMHTTVFKRKNWWGNSCNLKKILLKSRLAIADSDQIEIQEKLLFDVEQNLKKKLELRENGFTHGGFQKELSNLLIMILLFRNWVKNFAVFC